MNKRRFDTRLVHAGTPQPRPAGAITMPIYQSSTYLYGGEDSYDDVRYLRLNNTPNHIALHDKLASLEGSEAALVTASGMAAITTTLLTVLKPGDHLLAQRCLYGGTHHFVTGMLATMGVETTFVDAEAPETWEAARRPTTKAMYVEAMTNPLLEVAELSEAARFAREHGLVSVIDATFATPALFRPIEHGFDVVVHSATKYLNGHSDLVAGAIAGSAAHVESIRHNLNHLGGSLDPHACFLLDRGLKTLGVRVRHQCASAGRVASFLAEHSAVAKVNYPGLPSHPGHARARELFAGFGAMLSFELKGGAAAAEAWAAASEMFIDAPSLGGPESLVTMPAVTSHAGMDADVRRGLGIADGLLRLSIGLEDAEDLVEDVARALERAG